MDNAYKPPESSFRSSNTSNSGDGKMYKISGIGVATFVGGLIAGGILLAKNFRVLGKPDEARKALLYSALSMIGVIGIALLVPESWHIPSVVYLVPQIIAMNQYAKQHQEAGINAHIEKGGLMASNWQAAGIGLLVVVAMLAAIVPLAFLFSE